MALGQFFKSLLSGKGSSGQASSGKGGSPSEELQEPEDYNGFSIQAAPINEGGQYRVAGYISKTVQGVERKSRFIRADSSPDSAQMITQSLGKARQIIDEQGEKLFDRENV